MQTQEGSLGNLYTIDNVNTVIFYSALNQANVILNFQANFPENVL